MLKRRRIRSFLVRCGSLVFLQPLPSDSYVPTLDFKVSARCAIDQGSNLDSAKLAFMGEIPFFKLGGLLGSSSSEASLISLLFSPLSSSHLTFGCRAGKTIDVRRFFVAGGMPRSRDGVFRSRFAVVLRVTLS